MADEKTPGEARPSGGPAGPQALPPLTGTALTIGTIALSLATFMNVLDTSIANVSIPAISGDLGVSPDQGTWVITSFGVANAISLPLTGWLTRTFGQVKLFMWSVTLFTIASFLCALAPSLNMLILFRVLQGAVAGPMMPLSQALLLSSYPKAKAGAALGMWSITTLVAPVVGPVLGGWITDNISWPWIFYINVPVGIGAAVATWFIYKKRETPTEQHPAGDTSANGHHEVRDNFAQKAADYYRKAQIRDEFNAKFKQQVEEFKDNIPDDANDHLPDEYALNRSPGAVKFNESLGLHVLKEHPAGPFRDKAHDLNPIEQLHAERKAELDKILSKDGGVDAGTALDKVTEDLPDRLTRLNTREGDIDKVLSHYNEHAEGTDVVEGPSDAAIDKGRQDLVSDLRAQHDNIYRDVAPGQHEGPHLKTDLDPTVPPPKPKSGLAKLFGGKDDKVYLNPQQKWDLSLAKELDNVPDRVDLAQSNEEIRNLGRSAFDDAVAVHNNHPLGIGRLDADGIERAGEQWNKTLDDLAKHRWNSGPEGRPATASEQIAALKSDLSESLGQEAGRVRALNKAGEDFHDVVGHPDNSLTFDLSDEHLSSLSDDFREQTAIAHERTFGDGKVDLDSWLEHDAGHGDGFGSHFRSANDRPFTPSRDDLPGGLGRPEPTPRVVGGRPAGDRPEVGSDGPHAGQTRPDPVQPEPVRSDAGRPGPDRPGEGSREGGPELGGSRGNSAERANGPGDGQHQELVQDLVPSSAAQRPATGHSSSSATEKRPSEGATEAQAHADPATSKGACRIFIGPWARSDTFPLMRSAPSSPRSSMTACVRTFQRSMSSSLAASSQDCWTGCGPTSTAWARRCSCRIC